MDRKMLLSMLTDEMLLDMLEGCKVVQGGMIGVVENKMLKTSVGKVDLQPSLIVSITPASKVDCAKCKEECDKCKKLEKEIAQLTQLKKAKPEATKAKSKAKKEEKE